MMDRILCGDALEQLRTLPDGSVHCCVTSPPYYCQRDYGVSGQIGLEASIEEYTARLVEVFHEVRRVLYPAGVLYLNLGDTYYSGKGKPHGQDDKAPARNFSRRILRAVDASGWGIPQKSLIMAPWHVASALQMDGWTLRSDIIWHRQNAMPEPGAHDRPHRRYEHIFLFARSRHYHYDRSALDGEEDVWTLPAASTDDHSAAYPLALAERCILTGSRRGDTVLDPFMGSGTTVIAAERHSRHYLGIELNPVYIQLAEERLGKGIQRVLWSATGSSEDEAAS